MQKFLGPLYCIVLFLSVFLLMYDPRLTLVKPSFASLSDVNKVLNAPTRNVYFLFYAENSRPDVNSANIFLNMCKNIPQNEYYYNLDDSVVDAHGLIRPVVVEAGEYLAFFGGPSAQPSVKYYEEAGEAPLAFKENDTCVWWETKEGHIVEEAFASRLEFDDHHDTFVLEFFLDRFGRGVFIAYGYGRCGTLLASLYFRDVIYPDISQYTKSYYIFEWFDSDYNGIPEVNEIAVKQVKYVSVQAVMHKTDVNQSVLEWFATSCHSRGLRITWYVNPVNLNESIVSLLKGYAFVGDCVELSFGNVFFNEMKPKERLEHVDSHIAAFRDAFGFYPALVEAYYIDAYALSYIVSHYPSVKGSVGYVNHEVFVDNFKSSGAYYMPYFPSKYNTLLPNNSSEDKLDLVMLPFIHRDIADCVMKKGVLYSLNPQDGYTTVENWRLYFRHLLYAFVDGWDQFGFALYLIDLTYPYVPMKVIEEDLDNIRDVIQWKNCSNVLDSEFADWFRSKFEMSPSYRLVYKDPISESFSSVWYFTPMNRMGYVDGRLLEYSNFVDGYEKCFNEAVQPYDNSMQLARLM